MQNYSNFIANCACSLISCVLFLAINSGPGHLLVFVYHIQSPSNQNRTKSWRHRRFHASKQGLIKKDVPLYFAESAHSKRLDFGSLVFFLFFFSIVNKWLINILFFYLILILETPSVDWEWGGGGYLFDYIGRIETCVQVARQTAIDELQDFQVSDRIKSVVRRTERNLDPL